MNMLRCLSDNVRIDPQKCIVCGICVETCILDNIRLQLAPCRQACPIHTNCQGYVQLAARGKLDQALAVIREGLAFPGIIGRICTHPCEAACNRTQVDGQPVAIRALKRFLDEHESDLQLDLTVAAEKAGRVAIIGSGPAGMMAAWELRKAGFQVEIFEKADRPGGMLALGIPEFRLPQAVVSREFSYLEKLGCILHLNSEVGKTISLDQLLADSDAIFIATGAYRSPTLGLEGEQAKGVYQALDFLRIAKTDPGNLQIGQEVIVIGGGNAAVDAAQTALRCGAGSVKMISLEARAEMPAFDWEIDDAFADGVEIVNSLGVEHILVTDGVLNGVVLKTCTRVFDDDGQFNPRYDDSDCCAYPADTLILAIGQRLDAHFLAGSGLVLENGWISADRYTLATSNPKIFAGGDAVSGPKSVIEAMAAGKEAAESIRRLLSGEDIAFGRDDPGVNITQFDVDLSQATTTPRLTLAHNRTLRLDQEIEGGMSESQAVTEAQRCLNCGLPQGYYRTCWFCLPCEVECPEEALWIEIPYLMR